MSDQSADETIVVKYLVDAQDAIARANEFRANVNKIKDELKSLASQSGRSFKDIAEGMKQSVKVDFQAQINEIKQMGAAAKMSASQIQSMVAPLQQAQQTRLTEINTALSETEAQSKNAGSSFGVLGTAIGTALGFTTYQMVSKFFSLLKDGVQWLKEAAAAGYDFAKAVFQVQIGVNALRRAGVDITFLDVYKNLTKLKKEFGIFSTTELVQGAAAFLNLNRDMGFTKEQLFSLQEAVATLATVNGRSMEEVQRTVALALSSGYTEGLQRLGVSINRVTIAQEANRLGYGDTYMALTEVERAQATYNLILQKTAVYSEDLLKYQETIPGSIDAITAEIVDLKREAGESLIPIQHLGKEFELLWTKIKKWMAENSLIINSLKALDKVILDWNKIVAGWAYVFGAFADLKPGASIKDFINALAEIPKRWNEIKDQLQSEEPFTISEPEIIPKNAPALTDDQVDAVDKTIKEINDLEAQAAIDRRDMAIDLQRDLAEIEENGAQEREDIVLAHNQKLADIMTKYAQEITDAGLKYNLDVHQAWDDYYSNVQDANRKHSDKMLKIEEDYQEKLLRLREGFLLDLEDALQARDARQVLNLIRRYNLERNQAKRERDQNQKEEERGYKDQLKSAEKQRDERLHKLREEYIMRLQMLDIQRRRELDAEKKAYEDKLVQQKIEEQRRKEDREQRNIQELDDLKRHNQDRVNEIAKGLVDAGITTQKGLDGVYDIMEGYIGQGGSMLLLWQSYAAQVRAIIASAFGGMAAPQIQFPPHGTLGNWDAYAETIGGQNRTPRTPPRRRAQGGLELATKPTMAIYGEGGMPELHAFIPLPGGIGSLSSTSSAPMKVPESKSTGRDKAQIEILLGAGLEGRIIDKTLDNVADIIIKRKMQQ